MYPIELIMERGRRFESNEVQVVSVADLAAMNLHVATVWKICFSSFLSFYTVEADFIL